MTKVPSGLLYMTDYIENHGFAQNPSDQPDDVSNTQLSGSEGVFSDVSSVALNPGLLGAASKGKQSSHADARTAPANPGSPALTDADLMLRVKDGDDSAFEYLAE